MNAVLCPHARGLPVRSPPMQGVITSLGREFPVEAVGLEACRDDQGSGGY